MNKYKLLKDYPHHVNVKGITNIPAGTIGEIDRDPSLYMFTVQFSDGDRHLLIETRVIENNPDWFEKIEEPYISEGEKFYWINAYDSIIEDRFINSKGCYDLLKCGNCFPTRLFTREEVESIAEEVKAIFKKHQKAKQ